MFWLILCAFRKLTVPNDVPSASGNTDQFEYAYIVKIKYMCILVSSTISITLLIATGPGPVAAGRDAYGSTVEYFC